MKKILLAMGLFLATASAFATGPGQAQDFQISKTNYSKNMFLVLECLSTKGLTDNFRRGDLALEHCKGEATATLQIGMVYNNLPAIVVFDLNHYENTTIDMIVCLSGVRGTKTSEDEVQQLAQDQTAFSDCDSLLNTTK